MTTLKQSINRQNSWNSIDERGPVTWTFYLKILKKLDITNRLLKDSSNVGNDTSSSSPNDSDVGSDTTDIISELRSIDNRLETMNTTLSTIKDKVTSIDESIKAIKLPSEEKGSSSDSGKDSPSSGMKEDIDMIASLVTIAAAIGGFKSKFRDSSNSQNGPVAIEDPQAVLDEKLNNLSSGINTWLSTTRKDSKALEDRHTQMKNGLSASLATLQQSINDSMANRNGNDMISKRREKMMENFKVSLKKFQNQLNLAIVGREQNNLIAARREGMIERFKASLMELQQAVSDALATRGTGEAIVARREEMIATFKKTFEELALFLKNVFKQPLKIVVQQFAVMGFVVITVLQKIESAISDVVNAIGSLKVAGSTLVSSAQNTIIEVDKVLQSIPSVESAVGASTSGTVNQQSTSDYEISTQKANEINASAGSQSASRQTIINMNSNMPVNASITNGMDMETFLRQLGIGVDMAMRSAAEGVPL